MAEIGFTPKAAEARARFFDRMEESIERCNQAIIAGVPIPAAINGHRIRSYRINQQLRQEQTA